MVGDYQGAAVVLGGNAFSAFAVGMPAAGKRFNEAMYEPGNGVPGTGGSRTASPTGAHAFTPARPPSRQPPFVYIEP